MGKPERWANGQSEGAWKAAAKPEAGRPAVQVHESTVSIHCHTGEGKTSAGKNSCGKNSVPNFGTVFFRPF